MNNGGGDGTGCFKIKVRTDSEKFGNMKIASFRETRDFTRKSDVLILQSQDCDQSEWC